MVRYNENGSLDSSFGTNGVVTTNFDTDNKEDFCNCIALQPDGKIVAGGKTGAYSCDFALVRYNTDGSLDTSFGTGGKVRTDYVNADIIYGITTQPDGKIVVVGTADGIRVARYNSNGSLDPTFSGDGWSGNLGIANGNGRDILIQSDGKIVISGFGGMDNFDFVVARFNSSGSIDSLHFGNNGKSIIPIGSRNDDATSLALQANDEIVVAGHYDTGSKYNWAVIKYHKSLGTSIEQNNNYQNKFELEQNYPNPFNPSTTIKYTLPYIGYITLRVYNVLGKEIATLVNQKQTAGTYQVNFDAGNLTSGIYFYKISADSFNKVRKMMLLK